MARARTTVTGTPPRNKMRSTSRSMGVWNPPITGILSGTRALAHGARLEVEQLVPENAGDAKLGLTVPRLLREVIGDLQIDVVGFDQCLTRPAFLDDRRQLFRNIDTPAIVPAILEPACQFVARVVIHHIDIQFALERETRECKVAAADKSHLRINRVRSVQQIELGVKLMLKEQLHGHFFPANLPSQTPQTGLVIVARCAEGKLGAKLLC